MRAELKMLFLLSFMTQIFDCKVFYNFDMSYLLKLSFKLSIADMCEPWILALTKKFVNCKLSLKALQK